MTIFNTNFRVYKMSRQISFSIEKGRKYIDIVLLYDGLFDWHFGQIALPKPFKGYMFGPLYFYYKY